MPDESNEKYAIAYRPIAAERPEQPSTRGTHAREEEPGRCNGGSQAARIELERRRWAWAVLEGVWCVDGREGRRWGLGGGVRRWGCVRWRAG